MVFTCIYVHILLRNKLRRKIILLHHSVVIAYRNTVIWLLFMYLLFIYLFQRLKQPWKMIICLHMSSVSLLLKLLLSVSKRFILALPHFLLSPSWIHWELIKILLTACCSQGKIFHWFSWPVDEAWNEWKKKCWADGLFKIANYRWSKGNY